MGSDRRTFEDVLNANQGAVRSYVAGMGIPVHAVDDVAQDVFLAYYSQPESCPIDVEPVRWLKGIARHRALSWFRHNAGASQRMALAALIEAQTSDAPEEQGDDVRLDALRLCLGSVDGSSRTILDSHYRMVNQRKTLRSDVASPHRPCAWRCCGCASDCGRVSSGA